MLNDGALYNLDNSTLTDLTAGSGGFVGLLGASEDLSSIYFIDTSALDGAGAPGQNNLYLWHNGTTAFIATLLPEDDHTFNGESVVGDWKPSPADRTSQVSADGRYLAFMSRASLTGYNNLDAGNGVADSELFEYDASTERLLCVSCNPTGARPLGNSLLSLIKPAAALFLPQPSNLISDGRVFFDSMDVLAPRDNNGRIEDVYEYEPQGVGSCLQPQGCISMISQGDGSSDSNFVAASPDGSNVFFTTRERLVSDDRDELVDLYDAREGGGFTPSGTSRSCTDETCRTQFPEAPVFANLVSGGLVGSGNLSQSAGSAATAPSPTHPLSRATKLAAALKACKAKPRRKRAECERRARKKYGSASKADTSSGWGSKARHKARPKARQRRPR